ncbi:MAG: amidophosphoribosyltransferase [Deltaproteobacteria bacterium]|nr:amidophosphoribosyltransferase [Deltaproteobacteria bacterium]
MCGIFGIIGHAEASNLAYLGLHALQHRGQESAGIVSSDGARLHAHRGMGLVHDVFDETVLSRLPGDAAIGHVRYSTAGQSILENAQPFSVSYGGGWLGIAHNGNLTNAIELRSSLEAAGSIFQSSSDTEAIVHLIARSRAGAPLDRIRDALLRLEGAFSLLFSTPDMLVAVRDPHGFRPLALGRIGNALVVASEPVAFDLIGAETLREVDPGEMVVIDRAGLRSERPFPQSLPRRSCIFEHVYFARPDSVIDGVGVYEARKNLGRILAEESPADADIVLPVPDSGVPAAIGFAERSGLPFEMGMIRSHYIGRTFIEPRQSIRHFGVRLKLAPVRALVRGKRVVVVDDSLVRGTTSRKIIKTIRDAGAREIHLRISSPPTRFPCFYGIDTPSRRELIASSHTVDEIAKYITADSLAFLSNEGLHRAVGGNAHCDACFSGNYPVPFPESADDRVHLRLVAN